MDDFTYDCWQKKQLAQQARHRKRGSKSRKCSLPSDSLTKKQWKERNGKTLSINLNQPTSWEIFKEVSKQTQEDCRAVLRGEKTADEIVAQYVAAFSKKQ